MGKLRSQIITKIGGVKKVNRFIFLESVETVTGGVL